MGFDTHLGTALICRSYGIWHSSGNRFELLLIWNQLWFTVHLYHFTRYLLSKTLTRMNMLWAKLLLLVGVFQELSGSITNLKSQGDNSNHCVLGETQKGMSLNCSDQALSYIPRNNDSFQVLIFSYNLLVNVTTETFENISKPENLTNLELDHNRIKNISSNALKIFKNLEILYLSNNPVYYYDLKHLLGAICQLKFLKQLRISGIPTVTIQKDLFSLMSVNHIEQLDVNSYNMKSLNMEIFSTFDKLEGLRLQNNQIKILELSKLRHLRSLYLQGNKLATFPNFSINRNETDCYFPKLNALDIRINLIREVGLEDLVCMRKITRLMLGGNPIEILHNNMLSKLPVIFYLNLRYIDGYTFEIEPFALRSRSLTQLYIGHHGQSRYVFKSLNDTFKLIPKLKMLDIADINMADLNGQMLSNLFHPLKTLLRFACVSCKISQDPKFILKSMKRLEILVLNTNGVTSLTDETFKDNKHLRYLHLRYNQLGHVPESAFPTAFLNEIQYLDFSGNPFVCDCGIEWFINWLKKVHSKITIQNYPDGYKCKGPTDKANILLSNVDFSYRECHPWSTWIWVAVIASPCVVVIALVTLIMYRNRWNIKHYIYLLRKKRNYEAIEGRNFIYNAFVAYEAVDSMWIRRRLLPIVEEEMGLKLCVHERDFQAGVFINGNIVEHMDSSEKIILVVTNAFARSEWCMFELKIAHSKLIKESTEVVVIQLEKIDAKNMNHSLKVLFNTTTYIEWTEDIAGQELFWTKLKDAIRK
ncbi:toll-like receptor 13 [Mercenaria mercenaria]|uniref:toll-like receptor 13 n=1 Tax=Mercenaria mercenaria TaxID=6596 RepID=UPI00234F4F36|nr:toll-like receptor 13 [Mercenaria mercenaria]